MRLVQKYSDVPTSLADACPVRMTETLANALVVKDRLPIGVGSRE